MKNLLKLLSVFLLSFCLVFALAFAGCSNDKGDDKTGGTEQTGEGNGSNEGEGNGSNEGEGNGSNEGEGNGSNEGEGEGSNEGEGEGSNEGEGEGSNEGEEEEEPFTSVSYVFDSETEDAYENSSYIDLTKTTAVVSGSENGNIVTYNVVTLAKVDNTRPNAFDITIVVGADGKISSYTINTNGSTNENYASKMLESVLDGSLFVGKTLAELEAIETDIVEETEKTVISTGATQSNTYCLNAALFAVANYETIIADTYTSYIDLANTSWTVGENGVTYNVVTLAKVDNTRPNAFDITIVVGADGKISSYTINTNGSTKDTYVEKMLESVLDGSIFVGKTLAELEAIGTDIVEETEKTVISTGATQSNTYCLNAALFAVANYVYVGEYQYTASGTNYGIKVGVTVNSDNVITSVTVLPSNYVSVTPALPQYGWSEEKVANWNDNLDTLLASYVGKTVSEVLVIEVSTSSTGAPSSSADELDGLVTTGATQGSGRLVLAVQNALSSFANND